MKIEFYDKRTLEIVTGKGWYFVDQDGDVYEKDLDLMLWCTGIGWRVVE